jgi:hypothetical protein
VILLNGLTCGYASRHFFWQWFWISFHGDHGTEEAAPPPVWQVARDFDLTGTAVRAWVARAKTERREAAALTSAERNCRDFVGETVIAVSRLILSP